MFRFQRRAIRALAPAFIVTALIGPGVFPRPVAAVEGLGSVTVIQHTPINGAQDFHYTSDVPEMATDFWLDDDLDEYTRSQEVSNYVPPGRYTITQDVPPAGWQVGNVVCTDPDGNSSGSGETATVVMDADEEIVCTFTNTPTTGDINVYQSTTPQDPTQFQFAGDFGPFSLADDGDETGDGTWRNLGVSGLAAGTYQVTQYATSGWVLTDISCSDPDGGTTVDLVDGGVTFDLDGGETIDCTFTNQSAAPAPPPPSGAIRIILDTVPDDPVDVAFTGTEAPFTLDDDPSDATRDNQIDFWAHDVGSTSFAAAVPAGFQLKDLTCTDPDGGTTVDASTATATVDLDNDEEVTCRFTIEPKPVAPSPPAATCNGKAATIVAPVGATAVRGTQGADVIVALAGNVRVDGRGGNDTICAGAGDNIVNGGAGDDWIDGGAGANTIDLGSGANSAIAGGGDDVIVGGSGNDTVNAGDGNNLVSLAGGNDTIVTGSGDDRIDGGKGFDTCQPGGGTNAVNRCEA